MSASPEHWISLGARAHAEGRYDDAIAHLRHALELAIAAKDTQRIAVAHFRTGSALVQLKKPEEALQSFRAALDTAPTWHAVRNNMGITLAGMNRLEDAIAVYTEAVNGGDIDARYNRAGIYRKLGRINEARTDYATARSLYQTEVDIKHCDAKLKELESSDDEATESEPEPEPEPEPDTEADAETEAAADSEDERPAKSANTKAAKTAKSKTAVAVAASTRSKSPAKAAAKAAAAPASAAKSKKAKAAKSKSATAQPTASARHRTSADKSAPKTRKAKAAVSALSAPATRQTRKQKSATATAAAAGSNADADADAEAEAPAMVEITDGDADSSTATAAPTLATTSTSVSVPSTNAAAATAPVAASASASGNRSPSPASGGWSSLDAGWMAAAEKLSADAGPAPSVTPFTLQQPLRAWWGLHAERNSTTAAAATAAAVSNNGADDAMPALETDPDRLPAAAASLRPNAAPVSGGGGSGGSTKRKAGTKETVDLTSSPDRRSSVKKKKTASAAAATSSDAAADGGPARRHRSLQQTDPAPLPEADPTRNGARPPPHWASDPYGAAAAAAAAAVAQTKTEPGTEPAATATGISGGDSKGAAVSDRPVSVVDTARIARQRGIAELEACLLKADHFWKEREYGETERYYREATQMAEKFGATPEFAARATPQTQAIWWFRIGYCCIERGDFNAGIDAYSRSISHNSTESGAYANRAFAKERRNAPDAKHDAIADYTTALRFDPQSLTFRKNRAALYEAVGDYPNALNDYAALKLHPQAKPEEGLAWAKKAAVLAARVHSETMRLQYQQRIQSVAAAVRSAPAPAAVPAPAPAAAAAPDAAVPDPLQFVPVVQYNALLQRVAAQKAKYAAARRDLKQSEAALAAVRNELTQSQTQNAYLQTQLQLAQAGLTQARLLLANPHLQQQHQHQLQQQMQHQQALLQQQKRHQQLAAPPATAAAASSSAAAAVAAAAPDPSRTPFTSQRGYRPASRVEQ